MAARTLQFFSPSTAPPNTYTLLSHWVAAAACSRRGTAMGAHVRQTSVLGSKRSVRPVPYVPSTQPPIA